MKIMLRNSSSRWGAVARSFHWVIVALIVVQFVLAKQANDLPFGLHKLVVLARHKSFGITILALATLRLLWRWTNAVPKLPSASMKPWERAAAHTSHWVLYALLFAMPISGWVMSSAKRYAVAWFGVPLPDLVGPNESLYNAMLTTHHVLAKVLFAVALAHILAALWHHFIRKDDVLRTMLPFATPRGDVARGAPDTATLRPR